MKELVLDSYLSTGTHYAVVYKGTWQPASGSPQPVAVRKVLLRTGLFYRRKEKRYLLEGRVVDKVEAQRAFARTKDGIYFYEQRSCKQEKFDRFVANTKLAGECGLGPKFFAGWIDKSTDIHYGFVVTGLCDTTLREIMVKRRLSAREASIVQDSILRLHKMGMAHGSCKPANIGVLLDDNGQITKCLFLDLGKLRPDAGPCIQNDLQKFAIWQRKHVKERTKANQRGSSK